MRCRGCQRRLSEWLDRDLSPRLQRAVGEHLAGCAPCRAVRDDTAAVRDLMAGLPVARDPADALWGRIDAALDADEQQRERRRTRWHLLGPAVGGAAMLAIVAVAQRLEAPSARRGSQALDVAMSEAAARAVRSVEERVVLVERDAADRAGVALVADGVGPSSAELRDHGFDRMDARLIARQRLLLTRAGDALAAQRQLVVMTRLEEWEEPTGGACGVAQ